MQGGGKRTRWTGLLGPASPSPTLGRETETAAAGLCQVTYPLACRPQLPTQEPSEEPAAGESCCG